MKKITLHLFNSISTEQLKKSRMKINLLLIPLVLLTNLMNAQEISYQMTSNIQGSEVFTNVTELNDDNVSTYKKLRAVNTILNIDTSADTELTSYSLVASNHTNVLFDSGISENSTGTESVAIGSGLDGTSLIVGGIKNTLIVPLTGLGVSLDEFTFSSLIKIASGTTGTVTLLSLETATPAEHIVFYYDIVAQTLSCSYKGDLKSGKAFTISADTQYQISVVITSSKLNIFINASNVASWKISGDGIPADTIENAYLAYDSSNSTAGSLIEYDGSYFFNEKLFANNQSQIHDNTKIFAKEPVAGSDFEFGARNWSLYGVNHTVDENEAPITNKILIDEQTNQSFTSSEQKDFNITPGSSYQEYELRCKGFSLSEFKLEGTLLAIDKFSENNLSITKEQDRIVIGSDKYFSYKIYDLTGILIKEQIQETKSSSLQLAQNRVYILQVQIENQVITKQIILQ